MQLTDIRCYFVRLNGRAIVLYGMLIFQPLNEQTLRIKRWIRMAEKRWKFKYWSIVPACRQPKKVPDCFSFEYAICFQVFRSFKETNSRRIFVQYFLGKELRLLLFNIYVFMENDKLFGRHFCTIHSTDWIIKFQNVRKVRS